MNYQTNISLIKWFKIFIELKTFIDSFAQMLSKIEFNK